MAPEAWLGDQLPPRPPLQSRARGEGLGSPSLGGFPRPGSLLCCRGVGAGQLTGLPGSDHGTEVGLGSNTGHADSDLCFLGSQPVPMLLGFRTPRRVTEQEATATLGGPASGPAWQTHPSSGPWAQALQQEAPQHSALSLGYSLVT